MKLVVNRLFFLSIFLIGSLSLANETVCDITDTDEDHCLVCACYLENVDSFTPGTADHETHQLLLEAEGVHEKDMMTTIQLVQARAAHQSFPNNSCDTLYQPRQFFKGGKNSFIKSFERLGVGRYTEDGTSFSSNNIKYHGTGDYDYKKEMLNRELVDKCKQLVALSKTIENPGYTYYFSALLEREPSYIQKLNCTVTTNGGTFKVATCPPLQNAGYNRAAAIRARVLEHRQEN